MVISSVQFSRSVVSNSLRPHESQHARPPCPSPTPGVHPDSTSTELVIPSSHLILCRPLLLLPPIPPSNRVFSNESTLRMRWPSTGVSALASFLPKNTKGLSTITNNIIHNSQKEDQFSSVAQSCPTLRDPMNRSMPGLPVHHRLPEFTQTHVHQVSDAIQPSHPRPSPSPPAPNPSQQQSLFQ